MMHMVATQQQMLALYPTTPILLDPGGRLDCISVDVTAHPFLPSCSSLIQYFIITSSHTIYYHLSIYPYQHSCVSCEMFCNRVVLLRQAQQLPN